MLRVITDRQSLVFDDMPIRDENQVKNIFKQVLTVMKFLHQNDIYYINLKTQNILFDDNGNLKLRDYLCNYFIDVLLNSPEGLPESVSQEEERRIGIKKDIESLVKLLSLLVYKKNVKINSTEEYQYFLHILSQQLERNAIDLDVLLDHPYMVFKPYSTISNQHSELYQQHSVN